MVSFFSSSYRTYQTYQSTEMPKKVQKLITDLEKGLPNLPPEKQNERVHQIAAIKAAAKSNSVKNALSNTAIEGFKAIASNVAGPLGSAIGTYSTHKTQEKMAIEEKFVINKGEKVGGRRIQRNLKKQKTEKTSAIWKGAVAGALGFGIGLALTVAMSTSAAKSIKDYGRSFVDYGKSYLEG